MPDAICPCLFCGANFTPKTASSRYCDDLECQRLRRNAKQRDFQRKHKAKHGFTHSRYYGYDRECLQCGKKFLASNADNGRYCSIACSNSSRRVNPRPETLRWRQARRKIAKSAAGTAGTIPWMAGHCAECGAYFVSRRATYLLFPMQDARQCSATPSSRSWR